MMAYMLYNYAQFYRKEEISLYFEVYLRLNFKIFKGLSSP